jgi:hypothetical protein
VAEENTTSTFTIAEVFEPAVQLVRGSLADANLRITGELNMSRRFQRALLVQTAPCLVLFACPATAPDDFPADTAEAAITPLHIVIAGRGSQTDVHILRVLPRDPDGVVRRAEGPAAARMVAMMTQAIERIGMRSPVGA